MRISLFSLLSIFFALSFSLSASAEAVVFTANLGVGSRGTQVIALQQFLNQDPDTRIASTGPGSPGNETSAFGQLTRAAVIRFQEKYTSEVLTPVGLSQGTGRVGSFTRTKLNMLSAPAPIANAPVVTPPAVVPPAPTVTPTPAPIVIDNKVTTAERIDIYSGDKMLANIKNRILSALNESIASRDTATATMPTITAADIPSVVVGALTPQSGSPDARISITGRGIRGDSVVYFGSDYIVRTLNTEYSGNFSFNVPSIPPGLYDIAIKTGTVVSNTALFVIRDPKNPPVHLQSVSPSNISYGDTLTITGSGFSPQHNTVITTYQKFTNVSSPDGKTLVIQLAPESITSSAKIGKGTRQISMILQVVNEYGFSDSKKSFTMTL